MISQLTVEENFEFFLRLRGVDGIADVIEKMLSDYDLKQCSNIAASRISKNQKKKLSVALAMMGNS